MSDFSGTLTHVRTDRTFAGMFWRGLSAHGIFFAITFAYFAVAMISATVYPPTKSGAYTQALIGVALSSVPIALLVMCAREFFVMVRTERPASPMRRLAQRMAAVLKDPVRMAASLPMYLAFIPFMFSFTLLKVQITAVMPFSWDVTFDQWDQALHFGYRPWELLQPVLGSGLATFLINFNYNAWFIVMNLFLLHFIFYAPPGEKRTHFYLTFMVMWMIGGSLLATVFSSAGPCYFDRIGLGAEAYEPLMTKLRAINETFPIWALDTQEKLWGLRQSGSFLGGISAMPSMHNASALLFVLVAWSWGGWLRKVIVAHAVLILPGSVHLGWHYAIDAYLAFALTLVVWFAMKPVSRWWHERPSVKQFDQDTAEGYAA